ncbi:MAG: hypothetical protein ACYC6L_07810 [Anaerolineae bacterium]
MRRIMVCFLVVLLTACGRQAAPALEPSAPAAEQSTAQVQPSPSASPTTAKTFTPGPTAIPTAEPLPKPKLEQLIITFWTPPAITEQSLQQISDGGFNLVMISPVTPSYGKKLLDSAQSLGLKVMITDPVLSPYRANLAADIKELTDSYKDHPALWGYFLTDEPGADLFADFARLNRVLLEDDPNHFPYIDLFPNYADTSQLGTADYQAYVRTFIESVNPAILSYDHYALTPQGDRPGYYANLEIIRSEALRASIPFMQIILATPFPGVRDVTAVDLRYQVYTTLAYGAKGISYFTYAVPNASFGDGLLDRNGNPTAKWEAARMINLEVARLGKWLLELESTGVYYLQPPEPECQPLSSSTLVANASGGRLQFGEFRAPDGARWLMVVNLDREQAVTAEIELKAPVTLAAAVDKATGELTPFDCETSLTCRRSEKGLNLSLDLAPADGMLLRLE